MHYQNDVILACCRTMADSKGKTKKKGRPLDQVNLSKSKEEVQADAIKMIKTINAFPLSKNISCKDWQRLFAQNGLKLTESQVNNVFKRKRDKRRPLTAEMYIALKEAMKDPKRNLLLRKTVTRMECQVAHDEALGVPTPCSLALPTEDPVEVLPEPSIRIKEHLIPVCAWVEVNGSKPEIELFKAFCKKVDISVNKEKKQSMIENYLNQKRNVLGDRASKSSSIDVVPSKSSSIDVVPSKSSSSEVVSGKSSSSEVVSSKSSSSEVVSSKSSSIDVVPSKSSSKDVLMGDQLDIPSCFVEVPRGYFCNVCKTTIAPSPDNSISRTIQKLQTHTSKSHLRVASNQKITPFLRPGSKQASWWNNNWYTHNRQG